MMRTMIKKKKKKKGKHSKRIKTRQLAATSERREDRVCSRIDASDCVFRPFYICRYDSILY